MKNNIRTFSQFTCVILIISFFLSACMTRTSDVPLTPTIRVTSTPERTAVVTGTATAAMISTPTIQKFTPTPVSSLDCKNMPAVQYVIPYTFKEATANGNNTYATLPRSAAVRLSQEEIAVTLLCGLLENYRSPDIDIFIRIIDYQIRAVYLAKVYDSESPDNYSVYLWYEVLPADLPTFWWAGASITLDNGWISNGNYALIKSDSDKYYLCCFWNG
jgi:hypothetical protein